MAWPPPVQPINRTNADPQQDTHPSDHNSLALAVNDLVERVQSLDAVGGTLVRDGQGALVAGSNWQPMVFNTDALMRGGAIGVGASLIQVPVAGIYAVTIGMEWGVQNAATYVTSIAANINGVRNVSIGESNTLHITARPAFSAAGYIGLNAGGTVGLDVNNPNTNPLTFTAARLSVYLYSFGSAT